MSRGTDRDPFPPTVAVIFWGFWLGFTAVSTVLWLAVWAALGSPGALWLDHPLTWTFLVPELVAAWLNPRYTLSHTLWTQHWLLRYGVGLWLGWIGSWTLYLWWGLPGALIGGLVFVWLSTPHMIRKLKVI